MSAAAENTRVGWRLIIGRSVPTTDRAVIAVDHLLTTMPQREAEIVADKNFEILRDALGEGQGCRLWLMLWEWYPTDDTVPRHQMVAAEWYLAYVRGGEHLNDAVRDLVNLMDAPVPM